MAKKIDLTGQQFGQLVVLDRAPVKLDSSLAWSCQCSCGTIKVVSSKKLRGLSTVSCGCARGKSSRLSHTPEYAAWANMLARCFNRTHQRYSSYGGRGISVCAEWLIVQQFIEDMGPRPTPEHSIDRIDNDLGYFKANCRWATRSEQQFNKRGSKR